jgi:hypothetical protein
MCTLGPGDSWGFILNRTKPPKSRCQASCWGPRGTGVVNSQCREQSPRGTRLHHVVSMTSICMRHCWWRPRNSPLLVGLQWKPRRKKNCSSGPKREEGLPFKEIPMRNTSAGSSMLRCTVKWPGCNQRTCCWDFSRRHGRISGEKPARGKNKKNPLLGVSCTLVFFFLNDGWTSRWDGSLRISYTKKPTWLPNR